MMGKAIPGNAAAQKALSPLAGVPQQPESKVPLNGDQWRAFTGGIKTVDEVLVNFVESLREEEFAAPVDCPFYRGKPPTVPLYFMLQNLTAHGIHHRGQVSQILDSLGIDNDYSGINVEFLR
jgi:uncharacterized damage-inducible protein DinB